MYGYSRQYTYSPELMTRARFVNRILRETYGKPELKKSLPPLDELMSTILSQNTTDANRDAAYESLRSRFPTWEEVRDADEEDVIVAVRVAGLANQKGPRMQKILRGITGERGSLDMEFLRDLPPEKVYGWLINKEGVGPKTASVVMLMSLDIPAFPVDTHVYRVCGRLRLRPSDMSAEEAHEYLAGIFRPEYYFTLHLNMIRLGREICKARKPKCPSCPLQDICDFAVEIIIQDTDQES